MSDIHGDLPSFNKMLKAIDFKEKDDFLIINGDVLDRGENGIELLLIVKDMVDGGYAVMLKGNHELFAQRFLEGSLSEKEWILNSGEASLNSLKKLDPAGQASVLEFIRQMPLYLEQDSPKYGKTVITHAGLMESFLITDKDERIDVLESVKKAAESDEDDMLITADIHYWDRDRLRMLDRFIICGHVPTYQLGPEYKGKVLENRAYINLDAGSGHREYGGRLACYCIDNEKVWYV